MLFMLQESNKQMYFMANEANLQKKKHMKRMLLK
jgi:hypothetical protein